MVYWAGKNPRQGPYPDQSLQPRCHRRRLAGGWNYCGKNYVWLSDWQLENVNNHHQLPVDFETYKKLKNDIAKTLVPLLQIWLYATRTKGALKNGTTNSANFSASASIDTLQKSLRNSDRR